MLARIIFIFHTHTHFRPPCPGLRSEVVRTAHSDARWNRSHKEPVSSARGVRHGTSRENDSGSSRGGERVSQSALTSAGGKYTPLPNPDRDFSR